MPQDPAWPRFTLATPLPALTDAVGKPLQQILGEQQVSEQHQPPELCRQLLQPVLRHVQAHQAPQIPELLGVGAEGQGEGQAQGGVAATPSLTGGRADSWFRSSHSSLRLGRAPRVSGCKKRWGQGGVQGSLALPGPAPPTTAPPSPHQHFQIIASQIQLFQLDQERQGPAEETEQGLLWPRGPWSLGPAADRGKPTHAGRDLSRFSRSSRVTRLARLKKTRTEYERRMVGSSAGTGLG